MAIMTNRKIAAVELVNVRSGHIVQVATDQQHNSNRGISFYLGKLDERGMPCFMPRAQYAALPAEMKAQYLDLTDEQRARVRDAEPVAEAKVVAKKAWKE
jgi:hypothetical protein